MHAIAALGAGVVAFFAVGLLFPAGVALIHAEWRSLEAMALLILGYGFFSGATLMAVAPRVRRLSRAEVFYATIVMWLALVAAAVPAFLLVENMPLSQAVFEASSAATTLGLHFSLLSEMSSTMVLYRGMIAWQGGLLTLLLAVYVLGRYEVGGTPNRHLRYILHSFESGVPRIVQTFFEVFIPYLALTLLCAAVLVFARTGTEDALNVALNIVSTNGFVPLQTGASVLNNVAGEIVLMVFMIIAATSIVWHRTLLNRRWQQARDQAEMATFLLLLVLVGGTVMIVALAVPVEHFTAGEAALNAVFDVVSIMTTTGITHDTRYGIGLPFVLVMAIALVGGCSYSTSGGVKVFRLSAMLRHSANEIRRLVFPHVVLARSVDEDPQELRAAKAVWSAFFLALLGIVLAMMFFSMQGVELSSSLWLAVGAFSSTGNLVAGAIRDSFEGIPPANTMLTISVVAVAARIELLVVLAAIARTK